MSARAAVLEGSYEIGRSFPTSIEIVVPVAAETGAEPGLRRISGRVRYQGCTENACLPPAEARVDVDLEITEEG
jgi:hypothetical protein